MDTITLYLPTSISGRLAAGFAIFGIIYCTCLVVYRLTFSPLAEFPGSKIAAVTGWYEFYYDVVRNGAYVYEIKEMHQKYGPIIRINPHEVSINDPAFYDELYVIESKRRTDNFNHFAEGINFDGSHFLTTPHDLHRRRRKPLEPFFSRRGVTRLEPMLAEVVNKLVRRFDTLQGTDSIVRLDHAFSAFSGDVIRRLCCGVKEDLLDDLEFAPHWFDLLHGIIRSVPLFMGLPFLIQVVGLIPESIVSYLNPEVSSFNNFKKLAYEHIADAKRCKENANARKDVDADVSLFRHIFNSDMPESELSIDRLGREAQVLLGAGTVSTARTLDFISYYILSNNHIRSRLKEELKNIMADYPEKVPCLRELERLPYLQAIINEGLRLSYGVMHRLPRCSPDEPLRYKNWTIPRNVPVGMSAYMMHTDPTIYVNPYEFNPERWLGNKNPLMTRNLVPFSRGSRKCLGMNLAHAELSFVLAAFYRPKGPNLELFETDESDVTPVHDFMIPLPKLDTKGVRVMVH